MRLFFATVFLFYFFLGFGQSYIIDYGVKSYPRDISKLPEVLKRDREYLKERQKSSKRIKVYQLRHVNGHSVYSAQYSTLEGVKEYSSLSDDMVIYKDFTEGCFIQTGKLVGKDQAVKEYFDEFFDWAVIQESDTLIAGFHCKKATTHFRNGMIAAWFTEAIPIMDGPGLFAGVPGLILQLQSNWGVTEVMNIQVVENTKNPVVLPKVKKYVSFKQFLRDRIKYLD